MASALFKFQHPIFHGLVSLVIFSVANSSWAVPVESVPNPRQLNGGWVSDRADLLSPQTEAELNRIIWQLKQKNGSEIAVVTVTDTAPSASPKEFATALFNRWGIGKKGEDNGVLFLISKGDRRVEIETGYGVEAILTDAKVGNIISQKVTPQFKKQNFNGGILAGTKALVGELNSYQSNVAVTTSLANQSKDEIPFFNWLIGIGGTVLAISGTVGVVKFARRRKFLTPEGTTRIVSSGSSGKHPYHCTQCKQKMEKIDDVALSSILSEPKRVAQELGSVKFEGWLCPRCRPLLAGEGLHLIAYILDSQKFSECPNCNELTASKNIQVLVYPNWIDRGKQRVELTCHCCDLQKQFEEDIPKLTPPIGTVFLEPQGRSRVAENTFSIGGSRESEKPTHCIKCNWQMSPVSNIILSKYLSQPEQVAQKLGTVKFIGWQCPHCSPLLGNEAFHLRAYVLESPNYKECQTCQEFTLEYSDRVVQPATEYNTGIQLISERCHCCGYSNEQEITIPCLPPSYSSSTNSSNSSSSSWSSDNSSSSSSYSSDSSSSSSYSSDSGSSSYSSDSSSSSDFGGGSSGGGGGGGDW